MVRTVRDVMTRTLVTVNETAGYKQIVRHIYERGVSAVPVVDRDGRLVGIVSEGDLLLKEEFEPNLDDQGGLVEMPLESSERKKAMGLVAADLMTTEVVTVPSDTPVPKAARLMHGRGLKRLPVVDDGDHVIGIVTRSDLLKVFLRTDWEIAAELTSTMLRGTAWFEQNAIEVTVRDGVVVLDGVVERRSMIPLVVSLVNGVEGVVGVESRLVYEVDDVDPRADVPHLTGNWSRT